MGSLKLILPLILLSVCVQGQVGIGTVSPNSTLDVRGSFSSIYRAFTGATNLTSGDHTVVFTGNLASTATLPDATACPGRIYCIKNFSVTIPAPVLTIATVSSQKIDGVSGWLLDETNETITIISDGSNWEVYNQGVPVAKSGTTGGPWDQGGNILPSMKSLGTLTNFSLPIVTNNVERMRVDSMGNVAIGGRTSSGATVAEKLLVNAGASTSPNLISATGSINNYLQFNIQNTASTGSASTDLITTNDVPTNYVDLGINSTGYNLNVSPILAGANNAYLYTTGSDFIIGDSTAGKNLVFFTGGAALSNERMRITGGGNVGIRVTNPANPLVVKDTLEIRRTGTISELLFSNTSGSGDFRIGSDGSDIFWQGGGGRNLHMGAFWGIVLAGDRQSAVFPAFQNGVLGTGVLVKGQRDAGVPLGVQANSASQSGNLTEWRNAAGTVLSSVDKNGNLGVGTGAPGSTLSVNGSLSLSFISAPAAYTVLGTDYAIIGTGAAATWTLPAASTCPGRVYCLINQSTGNITLSLPVTISSGTTSTNISNTAGSNSYQILSDGTVWRKIN